MCDGEDKWLRRTLFHCGKAGIGHRISAFESLLDQEIFLGQFFQGGLVFCQVGAGETQHFSLIDEELMKGVQNALFRSGQQNELPL